MLRMEKVANATARKCFAGLWVAVLWIAACTDEWQEPQGEAEEFESFEGETENVDIVLEETDSLGTDSFEAEGLGDESDGPDNFGILQEALVSIGSYSGRVERGRSQNYLIGVTPGRFYMVEMRPLEGNADLELSYVAENRCYRFASRRTAGRGIERLEFVPIYAQVRIGIIGREATSYRLWVTSEGAPRAGEMVKPVPVPDYGAVCTDLYSTVYRDSYEERWNCWESKGSHPGVDISVASGTRVRAVAAGRVIMSEDRDNTWGGLVVIEHAGLSGVKNGEALYSVYGHMRARLVQAGAWVGKGQVIGESGGAENDPHNGHSDGHHLHFQLDRARDIYGVNVLHPYWPKREGVPFQEQANVPDDYLILDNTLNPMAFVQTRD